MDVIIYIHGKNGKSSEAEEYKKLFPSLDVVGLDYKTFTPWETRIEIKEAVNNLKIIYKNVILIANSIGAFFSMCADIEEEITHAYFISPIVNMEKLISNMMSWANVTESELKQKGKIKTDFGEELSWDYLCYVRDNPIKWSVPTDIIYGSNDNLTSIDTINYFVNAHNASLTIMQDGEHWFHTEKQVKFLNNWIKEKLNRICF